MSETSWPSCQICSRSFKIITASHLRAHNHTFDTYRSAFPGAALVDESHKERLRARNAAKKGTKASQATKDAMSKSRTGKKHSQATKDAIGSAHKGKTIAHETTAKWKVSYTKAIKDNGGKGFSTGERSQEFKDAMSDIASERPREVQLAKAKLMQDARRGSKATPEQRENYKNGVIKWMRDNPNRVFNTGVEIAFKEYLSKNNVEYIQQFVIPGVQHPYDFYLPAYNTIVEIDGPQHWLAAIWGTSGKTQEQKDQILWNQMEKDAVENLGAIRAGYRIVRVQVKSDLGNFIEQMAKQGLII